MSFSVNTNITSLQAQDTLRMTSDFQAKTINRVTSGLRIVSSGDDAAGLAIANGFRSDQAVLSQGVRNANDGLSTLQTIDGGMSNISKLLDRARTLATQSASGTFNGDRNVLNGEFQSVMQEINRQAQAIGMDKGGQFAKSLSVFVGGGKGPTDSSALSNGSIGLDLSNSTVDVKSLGLDNYRAMQTGYDLSTNSATSISKIIANEGSTPAGAAITTATFSFRGAGFGDSTSQIDVSISTQGLTDTAGLATAINNAIYDAANPATETTASKAFKNAGITASIVTDSSGKQQLAFSSSSAAFQVHGDRLANAFMGFVADSRVSQVAGEGSTYVQASSALNKITTDLSGVKLVFRNGAGTGLTSLGGAVTLSTLNGSSTNISTQDAVDAINAKLDTAADAVSSGTTSNIRAELKDGKLSFYATDGSEFQLQVVGDANNALGLNNVSSTPTAGSEFMTTAGAGALAYAYTTTHLHFTDANGTNLAGLSNLTLTADGSGAAYADKAALAAALDTDVNGANANVHVSYDSYADKIRFYTVDGSAFRMTAWDAAANGDSTLGFTHAAADSMATSYNSSTSAGVSQYQALTSGGVYQSTQETSSTAYTNYSNSAYNFKGLATGDTQTITVNTKRSDGSVVSLNIDLNNSTAGNVNTAVDTINQALQATEDESLQTISAVRDQDGIRFMNTQGFSVTLGAFSDSGSDAIGKEGLFEIKDGAAKQAAVQNDATVQGDSGMADISNQASASIAVAALSEAVQTLGTAQAAVGKGQNQLNYAVNLAQSQLSNLAAAESRIRDADLASEAANLTKAQILMQAGVAALAQANSAPQQILSLLKG